MGTPEPKICRVCGRRFDWRKKWAGQWEHVTTCSAGCRKRGVRRPDQEVERLMLEWLSTGSRKTLVSPSEVARAVFADCGPSELERARCAARRLAARGLVELVQRGRVVDPSTARGEVSVRRVESGDPRAPLA